MKASFLNHSQPLLTAMIQKDNPNDVIDMAKNSIFDGAEAFGFQLECFDPQYRTEENYRRIFTAMAQRPIYITSYRARFNTGYTDEECMDCLLEGLKCGATLGDVMGDIYDPSPLELTRNQKAIDKQRALIDKIHGMGKEVLMSSHVLKYLPAEQVLEIACEQQKRGADIVKIVTAGSSPEEEAENLKITAMLKKELKVPFLFLSGGSHYKIHRMVGPMFGCVMYLCVQHHDSSTTKAQPILRAAKAVRDNTDFMPDCLNEGD